MMTEYVVLGALLVIMGGAQMWLRWGPWAKDIEEADEALARRRAEAAAVAAADEGEEETAEGGVASADKEPARLTPAGSRLWNKWTAILGPLGILLGLFLIFWGIFAG